MTLWSIIMLLVASGNIILLIVFSIIVIYTGLIYLTIQDRIHGVFLIYITVFLVSLGIVFLKN